MAPFSADPIDYDALVHHFTFRSVLGGLVSQHKVGGYTGIIADKWSVSENKLKWTFHIRSDAKYGNGDRIAPKDVVNSLTRIAYLMSQKGSKSELFSKIIDADKITSATQNVSGLGFDSENVYLQLSEPYPEMLELLSFGPYSIVHPNNYDPVSGKWLDPRSVISSSFYEVADWTDNSFVLKLRPSYLPAIRHSQAYSTVRYVWAPNEMSNADIIAGDSTYNFLEPAYSFHGTLPSSILYVHCMPWREPDHPLSNIETRRNLRDSLYNKLAENNVHVTKSFFPLIMNGIKEFSATNNSSIEEPTKKTTKINMTIRLINRPNPTILALSKALQSTLEDYGYSAKGVDVDYRTLSNNLNSDYIPHNIDLAMISTEIVIDSPNHDIRFMIESKEGIRLPDVDGRIHKEISKQNFHPQIINELLWDQAVIWPVSHYATGLWCNDNVDMSMLNHNLPPTDLAWMGAQ